MSDNDTYFDLGDESYFGGETYIKAGSGHYTVPTVKTGCTPMSYAFPAEDYQICRACGEKIMGKIISVGVGSSDKQQYTQDINATHHYHINCWKDIAGQDYTPKESVFTTPTADDKWRDSLEDAFNDFRKKGL